LTSKTIPEDHVRSGAKRIVVGGAAFAAVTLLAFPSAAFAADPAPAAVPGSAVLSAGTFTMTTPSALAFTGTLNGKNQVLSTTQALDVLDQTGSGAGWTVTLSTTRFTTTDSTPRLLATNAATDFSRTGVCDTDAGPPVTTIDCTLADNASVGTGTTVVAIPSDSTSVAINHAAAGFGLAGQTWTHTMHLNVPANTKVGTFNSTWTYSLVSAP
jgi:hypothetical protein